MGTVHLGQILGGAGFARLVAIKRMHPHIVAEPGALQMFRDEARLSARVRDPHTVATLDVVEHGGELLLVMDYVHGATLALLMELARSIGAPVPVEVTLAVAIDVLGGLQAIHEATDEHRQPLAIVHRDVSPQNVLVGVDGMARVLDFGIAKAAGRLQTTQQGYLKGKLAYMAPEHVRHEEVGARADQYAAAVVVWELLTGSQLFDGRSEGAILAKVLEGVVVAPSRYAPEIPAALDDVVMRGLSRDPAARFASCREMALALRGVAGVAGVADADAVGRWVTTLAGKSLAEQAAQVARVESGMANTAKTAAPEQTHTLTATKVSSPPSAEPPRARWLLPVVVLALTAASVLTFALRAGKRATPAASNTDHALVIAAAPTDAGGDLLAVSVQDAAPPVAASVASASPSVKGVSTGRPKLGPTRKGTRPNCNPMFTVDDNGIQRVKPECL